MRMPATDARGDEVLLRRPRSMLPLFQISGTRLVGRMSVGNKNGLLLPNSCTDQELMHIRNSLPDEVCTLILLF